MILPYVKSLLNSGSLYMATSSIACGGKITFLLGEAAAVSRAPFRHRSSFSDGGARLNRSASDVIPQCAKEPRPVVDIPPRPAVLNIVMLDILQAGEHAATAGPAARVGRGIADPVVRVVVRGFSGGHGGEDAAEGFADAVAATAAGRAGGAGCRVDFVQHCGCGWFWLRFSLIWI
jgi:hypothetical protein